MHDYPLLNLFWTMLFFFFWIMWIFLLVRIVSDIFRSADLSGVAKAVWTLFLIILPFIGALAYLVARGSKMHTREVNTAQANQEAMREYIRQSAGNQVSVADELNKLAALHSQGVLTDAEFAAQKAKLVSV